jgi:hypothetical protein
MFRICPAERTSSGFPLKAKPEHRKSQSLIRPLPTGGDATKWSGGSTEAGPLRACRCGYTTGYRHLERPCWRQKSAVPEDLPDMIAEMRGRYFPGPQGVTSRSSPYRTFKGGLQVLAAMEVKRWC